MTAELPRRVCIESPFGGAVGINTLYADACQFDSLSRGEAPFLGHLLYPRVLNDKDPAQRALCIAAHLAWMRASELVVFYRDRGMSPGMEEAYKLCVELHHPHEFRRLGDDWQERIAANSGTVGFLTGR